MIKEEALRRPEFKELLKVCGSEDNFIHIIYGIICFGFSCLCINTVSIYCFSFKEISKAKTGVKWSWRQECNRTAPSSTVRMLNKLC